MRLDKLLSNLGYCSRREVKQLIGAGRLTIAGKPASSPSQSVQHHQVRLDGAALDPAAGMVLLLNKPAGYTCSHSDAPPLIYSLLPDRFRQRKPQLSTVGRLDRDTTGLILITDDGKLNHRLTSPRHHAEKVYIVEVDRPLGGDEAALFATGGLLLEGDVKPLKPAPTEVLGERTLRLTLTEGRHHQVKRMLEAVDNLVTRLHRSRFANLEANGLPEGHYRLLAPEEIQGLS